MPTSLLPAIDPTSTVPPELLVAAGEAVLTPPDAPAPGPGNPAVPYVPAVPQRLGRRVQLMLTEPITHRPLTIVETADVAMCSFGYGPGKMSATAAAIDPAWFYARSATTSAYGRQVHQLDLRAVDARIGLNGSGFWSGVFQDPVPFGDGQVALSANSGEAVLDERTLGETEQYDFYEGRGSFPTQAFSTAGWSKTPNVTVAWNTTDPFEGAQSLRVTAVGATPGYVYGPWVLMPGHPDRVRYPVASAVVRIDSDLVMQVHCEIQKLDGTPVSPDFTLLERGVTDDEDSTWQGPVAGRGRLGRSIEDQRVRAVLVIPASGDEVDIDLVRLQWPTLTGYPEPTDLARYPTRIMRDAQYGPGGSPQGIVMGILSLTGVEEKITYPHQNDVGVGQALRDLREMVDGPDWWITPNWRMLIGVRGQLRTDVALTPDNIITCKMTLDPGGVVDEFRGITNIGTGTYRHVHGVDQPRRSNRRRIRRLTSVPDELGYDAGRRWTEGEAAAAAQPSFTAEVTVTFDEGLLYGEGDRVPFAWRDGDADGAPAYWGRVQVAGRTFDFHADTCVISVASGAVS